LGFKRRRSWPNRRTIPESAWTDWGKRRKFSSKCSCCPKRVANLELPKYVHVYSVIAKHTCLTVVILMMMMMMTMMILRRC